MHSRWLRYLMVTTLLLAGGAGLAGCIMVPARGRLWVPAHWGPSHVWVGGHWRDR